MIDFDVSAARALCDAASTEPWSVRSKQTADAWDPYRPDAIFVTQHGVENIARVGCLQDAEFIAAARTGWPQALDEVEALQARVDAVEKLCDEAERDDADQSAYDGSQLAPILTIAAVRAALGGQR